jgi:hypothetical protein
MGACQATPMQPRPYSSPGVPALLPARRASPSGGREVRDKGVTYYSVDLGRVQRGGRNNDADRDVTVIPVIPGRRAHQGRCGGAGHHRPGPARAAKGSGPGRVAPGVATLGHQFQLRMARSSPLSGRCRRAGSPVPVAHCCSSRSQGFLEVSVVTSSSCALPFLPGRRGFSDVAAVTGSRRAAVRLRTGLRGGHQVQLRIAYLPPGPPGDEPEALHASPPLQWVRITPGTGAASALPPPPCASHQW